jgi:hypothetical protein
LDPIFISNVDPDLHPDPLESAHRLLLSLMLDGVTDTAAQLTLPFTAGYTLDPILISVVDPEPYPDPHRSASIG